MANAPHPLVGRRVTHKSGRKARVLGAHAFTESHTDGEGCHTWEVVNAWWSLLVEWEDGSIDDGSASDFTMDRPSIKPRGRGTRVTAPAISLDDLP